MNSPIPGLPAVDESLRGLILAASRRAFVALPDSTYRIIWQKPDGVLTGAFASISDVPSLSQPVDYHTRSAVDAINWLGRPADFLSDFLS